MKPVFGNNEEETEYTKSKNKRQKAVDELGTKQSSSKFIRVKKMRRIK